MNMGQDRVATLCHAEQSQGRSIFGVRGLCDIDLLKNSRSAFCPWQAPHL